MRKEKGSFVLGDREKCTGCKACEIACFASHNKENHVGKTVGTVTIPVSPRLYLTKSEDLCMPVQCRHCENAPCLNSCTVGAICRIEDTVVINNSKCIGCKNCLMACPFGAIELVPRVHEGILERVDGEVIKSANKCDLCVSTGNPACVEVCPNHALRLVSPEEEIQDKRMRTAEAMVNM